jgi:thymidylate synthase ThyX
MSRRYTKVSKVEWEFYGDSWDCIDEPVGSLQPDGRFIPRETEEWTFWDACKAEYQRRLDAGWPNEIARGCMPVESMTRFWCAGFDRDWEAFLKLRDDAHAQPEIRVFAQWISGHLKAKKEIVG